MMKTNANIIITYPDMVHKNKYAWHTINNYCFMIKLIMMGA